MAHRQEQAAVALLIIAFNHTHEHICALPRGWWQLSSSLQAFQQAAGALRNLSANHPENQRKIGAQVANAHEYICAARTCMAAF
jgi:hypothetical protein